MSGGRGRARGAAMEYSRRVFADACEQERGLDGWLQRYAQLRPGGYHGTIDTLDMPGVAIARERINVAVEERVAAPPGTMVFAQTLSATAACRTNANRLPADGVMLLRGGDEVHVAAEAGSDFLIVTIDADRLPKESRRVPPGLLFMPSFAGAEMAGAWFLSLLLGQEAGMLPGDPEPVRILVDLIADKLSFLFGRIVGEGRACDPASRTDYRLFLRARELVLAEDQEPHSIGDLSRRLDVPVPALRRAFLAAVGVGPGVWLRQHRLDGARRDLASRAAEGATTVSEVAMKWGFWHLGRFSAYYAALYGETPSQTIRRAAG